MSLLTPGDKWSGKKRLEFAALKRKRCLGTKEDELLYEKECIVKKPRVKSTKYSHPPPFISKMTAFLFGLLWLKFDLAPKPCSIAPVLPVLWCYAISLRH